MINIMKKVIFILILVSCKTMEPQSDVLNSGLDELPNYEQKIFVANHFSSDSIEGPTIYRGSLYASNGNQIVKINLDDGKKVDVLATPVPGAKFNGLAILDDTLYALDEKGKRIYEVDLEQGTVKPLANLDFSPNDLVVYKAKNQLYLIITSPVWESTVKGKIYSFNLTTRQVALLKTIDTKEVNGIVLDNENELWVNHHDQLVSLKLTVNAGELFAEEKSRTPVMPDCKYMDGMKMIDGDRFLVSCYQNNHLAVISTGGSSDILSLDTDIGNPTNLVVLPSGVVYVTIRNSKKGKDDVDIIEMVPR